jgi:hypothetical protein
MKNGRVVEFRVIKVLCALEFPWPGIARTIWAIVKGKRGLFSHAFPNLPVIGLTL